MALAQYELVDLSNKPESYLKLNEKGTVPTLVTTDGSVLTESDDSDCVHAPPSWRFCVECDPDQ